MFNLGDVISSAQAKRINPIVLAFVGDAVYSLFVRTKLVFSHDCKTGELNKLATKEVNAGAQAEFITKILPLLTEEEISFYKSARNAKKTTRAKHASVVDYNMSTGFEALLGYLYLTGQYDRLNFLLAKGNNYES